MKKILMFLCCVFAFAMTDAFADCPSSQINTNTWFQGPTDNEFLYTSRSAYDYAKANHSHFESGGTSFTLSGGKVYECDPTAGCGDGTFIWAPNGFVLEGRSVGGQLLQCVVRNSYSIQGHSATTDNWQKLSYQQCDTNFFRSGGFENVDLEDYFGVVCYRKASSICCISYEGDSCIAAELRGEPANWTGKVCNCGNRNGKSYNWNSETGKCDEVVKPAKPTKPVQPSEAEACNNSTGAKWVENPKTKVWYCDCGKGKHWDKEKKACLPDGGGNVVVVDDTPPAETKIIWPCPSAKVAQLDIWLNEIKDDVITVKIKELQKYCEEDESRNENDFNIKYNEIEALIAKQTSKDNIKQIAKELDDFWDELDVSRWKNEEGKFNTARLASDSIAGVVLGTAGGLITSNIVKKSQVRKGFDDISCTIGGQYVADWDDEFTVGIK